MVAELGRLDVCEEVWWVDDLEQREVAVVADRADPGDRLVRMGLLLDLQEGRVRDDVGPREEQSLPDDDRRTGAVRWGPRLPRAVEVGVLGGRKDANHLGVGHDPRVPWARPSAKD